MKHFYFLLFYLLFNSFAFASDFGNLNYGYALNIASKQRMLSQRITKTALLQANHMGSNSLKIDLEASISLFKANHNILFRNAEMADKKFISILEKERQSWDVFITSLKEFKGGNLISFLNKSKALLEICDQFVTELTADANLKSASISTTEDLILQASTINIVGKQRMLFQKFSVYYLASELYGMQDIFSVELEMLRKEQRDDLSFLIFNSLNNQEIEEQFIEITLLFELLDKYRTTHMDMSILKVVSFCDRISNIYESITNNYTELYEELNIMKQEQFSSLTSTNK